MDSLPYDYCYNSLVNTLLQAFIEAHQKFVKAADHFPLDKREQILFDKWSLKQILIHIAGWNNCIADNVAFLKENKEPPFYGKVDDHNKQSITNGKNWSWDKTRSEFEKSFRRICAEYSTLPENLWNRRFWAKKNSTPEKFLKIVTKHYQKEHLPEIQAHLL